MQVDMLSEFDIARNKDEIEKVVRHAIPEDERTACWDAINRKLVQIYGFGKGDVITGYILVKRINQSIPTAKKDGGGKPVVEKRRGLLIYGLWSSGGMDDDDWIDGFRQLMDIARAMSCEQILAFTENPEIRRLLELFHFNMRTMAWRDLDVVDAAKQENEPKAIEEPEIVVP